MNTRISLVLPCLLMGLAAQMNAQFSSPVRVVNNNQQPVPVSPQGTTAVAGTVTIGNTPQQAVPVAPQGTTTVAGTVGISGTPSVTIANLGTSSVPTVNLSDPGRQALNLQVNVACVSQIGDCEGTTTFVAAGLTVPGGKRLVIEHISATTVRGFAFPFSTYSAEVSVNTVTNSGLHTQLVPLTISSNAALNFAVAHGAQPMRFYIDPNVSGDFRVLVQSAQTFNADQFVVINVTGYFIDCSGGTCH